MFSIENDIIYSIEYIDRSNWLVKKIPVMDKETFIKCFKEWITPGEKTVGQGRWISYPNSDIVVCNQCRGIRRDCRVGYMNYCNKCGTKMENADE